MTTQFPLPTLGPTLTPAGITAPPLADILRSLQESVKTIYGADVYIDPDSQDGQLLALFAQAMHDANQACISAINSFSPAKAVGEVLSSNVKINGITRKAPTRSTVIMKLVGVVGTVIADGRVEDTLGQRWILPPTVIIPTAGEILVLGTAELEGAVVASANTITRIATPTLGWQTATNPNSATPGQPVETDAELRIKQALSVSTPAVSVLQTLEAALLNLDTVSRARVYENDTGVTDTNGIPPHSIAAVVEGGDPAEIAETIRIKKTPGGGTYGSTTIPITNPLGFVMNVSFTEAEQKRVIITMDITPGTDFATSTQAIIKQALADYVNDNLAIGQKVDHGRLYLPAQLYGQGELYRTFEVNEIELAFFGGTPAAADLAIAFDEVAALDPADITITVTP